jgi:hypothetical protein
MTRAELITYIETKLATGSNITAAEHVLVEKAIVDFIPTIKAPVAYGRIGPIDIADSTTSWSVNGDLYSATRVGSVSGGFVQMRVTFPSGLGITSAANFKVRIDVESASASPNLDNDMLSIISRKNGSSTNTFDLLLEETPTGQTTSIYVYVEVIPL